MRGAVLQGLEFADQFAELLAHFQIGGGDRKGPAAHPGQFRSGADPPGVEHGVQQRAPAIDFADHRAAVDIDPVKGDVAGDRTVDQPHRIVADACGIARHRKQRHAVGIAIAARSACRHDQRIGSRAVDHKVLPAGQAKAVARAFGLDRDAFGPVLGAFVQRQGQHAVTRNDPRQIAPLQIVRCMCQRGCADHRS